MRLPCSCPIDRASNKAAIICKRYYVEVILNKIGFIRHLNKTDCKPNKIYNYVTDKNTLYTKRLGFTVTEKEKKLPCTGFLKCIRFINV